MFYYFNFHNNIRIGCCARNIIIKYVTFTVKSWCVSIQLVIFKNLKIH